MLCTALDKLRLSIHQGVEERIWERRLCRIEAVAQGRPVGIFCEVPLGTDYGRSCARIKSEDIEEQGVGARGLGCCRQYRDPRL